VPDGLRSLPSRPSLRYLRLEAKRRLATGEFTALHQAQVAIAWEHGLPSWAVLKQRIGGKAGPDGHAMAHLRWIIARFSEAGQPGWDAPGDDELRAHFDDRFLSLIPPAQLAEAIARMAADLRGELIVIAQTPFEAHVQLVGIRYVTAAAADPPYRLLGLQGFPVGERITDTRLTAAGAEAGARTLGAVPAGMTGIADDARAELGLAGLVLAGGEPGVPPWVVATGWADLDRAEVLTTGHRFPAPGVTAAVTTTAVLRLVAQGLVGLDAPANDGLRTVRLADGAVTVRELLNQTSGVGDPVAPLFGDGVLDPAELMGPVVPDTGHRGEVLAANGSYIVLGQLVADVTQAPYADAVTRLVLDPLRMRDSTFPARLADIGAGAVTGYNVTAQGIFVASGQLCTAQAVGGLWSTGADLVRLGTGWPSLLPEPLVREALVPRVRPGQRTDGGFGLGWIIGAHGDVAVLQGLGLDSVASLHVRVRGNRAHVVLTNRPMATASLDHRLWRAWTNPSMKPEKLKEKNMQQYPGSTQMPEVQRQPAPASVLTAVKIMYAGAVTSILGIIIDIITVSATKTAIEKRSPSMTASQINSTQHVLVIGFVVAGLIGAGVWFWLARSNLAGKNWARITGTVLFALATVDSLIGLTGPVAALVKIWGLLVWLIGLAAIVFLWRRDSTAFFKAPQA
jgi:CubicO group peptidase (beta-lactamase class C family)